MALYFMQNTRTKDVKIGFSKHPRCRLKVLQTGCPGQIELLGCIECNRSEERQWHEKLKEFRIHGEWFRGEPRVLEEIERALSDSEPLEELEAGPHVIHKNSVYTISQAAAYLGLAKGTLPREVRLGRLRVSKRAGRYFVLGEWLLMWLETGEIRR